MRLYIIVHKIRRMDMQQIILGSAGFLLYFIYDINSVRKQNRYLQKFLYLILDYSHNHYTFKHFGV